MWVVWGTIQKAVEITLLAVGITMLFVIHAGYKENKDYQLFENSLALHRMDTRKLVENHLQYLEGRINYIATNQDTYQISTSRRLDVLENRVKVLQEENQALRQMQGVGGAKIIFVNETE